MSAYNEASTPTTRTIILNFSGLEYMNSSGIGLIVTLLIRVNRQKQHLLAFGLSEHYRHIFEKKPVVDWLEIISENFMVDGGRTLETLDQILDRYRVV